MVYFNMTHICHIKFGIIGIAHYSPTSKEEVYHGFCNVNKGKY